MRLRVRGLRLPLHHESSDIIKAAAIRIEQPVEIVGGLILVRKSVDARRNEVYFTYTVEIELPDHINIKPEILDSPDISIQTRTEPVILKSGNRPLPWSPVICGLGPAGLFAALCLARSGYKPVVIEQGQDIDRRVPAVENFWQGGEFNPYSNAQFGEGGAGTFSDGKLTTRSGDERVNYVLQTMVNYGADEEILYLKKPHVGTDIIRQVVKGIRREIIELGGEVYFDARLTDLSINQTGIKCIIINNRMELPGSLLVLAVGHSARPLYQLLYDKGVKMLPKAFAIGVRIEHPQEFIDQLQYGQYAGHEQLGAADYHLTWQDTLTGRALYTFCMCPGGYVIAASSEPGQVVTNGMSYLARNSGVANSALVVTVTPADWDYSTLGGVQLQQFLESKAFAMGGSSYHAPAQRVEDFLNKRISDDFEDGLASYKPGVAAANLWDILPYDTAGVLERGLKYWNRKMPGFIHPQAVLTAIETRTSAPLRIERNREMVSVNVPNLYPCGEGAGYAGGIVSAAVDGLKIAEKIICTYRLPDNKLTIVDSGVTDARKLTDTQTQPL
ncbi:MAG: hypothetical protein PHD40_00760 [Syntrophomonadaceae bacterium]|nr:hypothetical protein [Syntrophomonadaceae bacterium]